MKHRKTFSISRRSLMLGASAAAALAMFGAAPATAAEGNFPNRPITLVSPYLAGGSADGIARAIATAAAKELGQPVVVETKPGAEGMIGSMDVMRSQPDGYRVLWGGAGSMMVVPALRKTPPFDPEKAFTPIAGSIDFSFFLYTHPSLEVDTLQEFIDLVKANPGKYNYATGNNQGLLTFNYLNREHGLDLEHIAYKGEAAVINDFLPGRVHAMFGTTAALPHAKDGKLDMLVTTLPERSPLAPDVPTMKEAGFEDVPFSPGGGWLGIFGPAGMDEAVQKRLHDAFNKAFEDPDVKEKIYLAGLTHTPMSIPELENFVRSQRDLYIKTVRDLEIPLLD